MPLLKCQRFYPIYQTTLVLEPNVYFFIVLLSLSLSLTHNHLTRVFSKNQTSRILMRFINSINRVMRVRSDSITPTVSDSITDRLRFDYRSSRDSIINQTTYCIARRRSTVFLFSINAVSNVYMFHTHACIKP